MGLYSKETATNMDLVTVDGANGGLKARTQYIEERKLAEMSVLLHCDVINLDCRVHIIKAQLCIRHVKLSDEKFSNPYQLHLSAIQSNA